jgi:AAA15 family ATPase/GTPase
MLLEFSLSNYRSFYGLQKLDLRATPLVSEDKSVDDRNIIDKEGNRVLKTVGLYGPNGSGKSNLVNGLKVFCRLVKNSLLNETVMSSASDPFKQTNASPEHNGFFQAIVSLDGKKYRYGFTLNDHGGVQQEWLFGPAEKNETWYFKRTGEKIESNKERFEEGNHLPLATLRPNTLFLTFVSAFNGALAGLLKQFFDSISFDGSKMTTNHRINEMFNLNQVNWAATNDLIRKGDTEIVLRLLNSVGLPYSNIRLEEIDNGRKVNVLLEKSVYDANGNETGKAVFDLEQNESSGTQKFYALIGWLQQKFAEGGVIVEDELDNNFHPSLLRQVIRFFNNKEINPKGAQLLFTSHDVNLLDPEILRRDQIYFTEKSVVDETILYSLADLKGIRNNSDFARQYLAGFYGALPILQKFKADNNH